jgi:hypothetical protein
MIVPSSGGGQALLTQFELRPSIQIAQLDSNERFARVAFHAPCERKTFVQFYRLEDAGNWKDLAVRQMHSQAIASADAWLKWPGGYLVPLESQDDNTSD